MSARELITVGGRSVMDRWLACRDGNDCYLYYYLMGHGMMDVCLMDLFSNESVRGYGKGAAHGEGTWWEAGYAG